MLAASAGGHISQLLKISEAWSGEDVCFVTTTEVLKTKLEKKAMAFFVGESNREHFFKTILVFFRCLSIILKTKPEVVISTGALHGCLLCYMAKCIFRSKVVWIDSITNTERPSLSGRLVYPVSDLFILQWQNLLEKYPKAEYYGTII